MNTTRESRFLYLDGLATMRGLYELNCGHELDMTRVGSCSSVQDIIQAINELSPTVLLLELRHSRVDGSAIISELRKSHPGLTTLVVTGSDDVDSFSEAVRSGASGVFFRTGKLAERAAALCETADGEGTSDSYSANPHGADSASEGAERQGITKKKQFENDSGKGASRDMQGFSGDARSTEQRYSNERVPEGNKPVGRTAKRFFSGETIANNAVISLSLEGIVTGWSIGATRLFGYAPEEMVGKSVTELLPKDRLEEEKEILAAIKQGRSVELYETVRIHKNGSELPVALTVSPWRNDAGCIKGAVKIVMNLLERKSAEREVLGEEERVRLAIEATGVGIWEWNLHSNWVRWSDKMFHIYGIPPTPDGLTTYYHWSRAVLPEDLSLQESLLQDTIKRIGQGAREFRIRRPDTGEIRYIQAFDAVRADSSGRPEWMVGTNLDITERIRAEEALKRQERLYRSVTDNAAVALFIMDEKQHCVFMNPAAEQLTGYTIEEVKDRPLHDMVHHTRPDGSPYPLCECPIDRAFPERDRMKGEEVFI